MKKLSLILLLIMGGFFDAKAQSSADGGATIQGIEMQHDGSQFVVEMVVDLSDVEIHNNRAVVYTPVLYGNGQQLELSSIGLFGRRRYIVSQRNDWMSPQFDNEWIFRKRNAPEVIDYRVSIPYEAWMNGARLRLDRRIYGCLNRVLNTSSKILGEYEEWIYEPFFIYVQPEAEREKMRQISGSAFIDFPVSQAVIRPEFRQNRTELQKITRSIDSIRSDKDITLRMLSIKGYASPEGPYLLNERLAKERTEALKGYVEKLYNFPAGLIRTDYEAENWQGLRQMLDTTHIAHKSELLAIVESNLEPDRKDARLKSAYPTEYRTLLREYYPALRRSDYRIEYVIRSYTDPKEILTILEGAPSKLSLNELFLASNALEPGSEAYNDLFETAVRMFPDSPTANLNAANAAMSKGNLRDAERYLQRAGESAEAIYARGVLAMLKGDYRSAESHFRRVESRIDKAREILQQLQKIGN